MKSITDVQVCEIFMIPLSEMPVCEIVTVFLSYVPVCEIVVVFRTYWYMRLLWTYRLEIVMVSLSDMALLRL